jgi:hypothetical protein
MPDQLDTTNVYSVEAHAIMMERPFVDIAKRLGVVYLEHGPQIVIRDGHTNAEIGRGPTVRTAWEAAARFAGM